jgi:hypothetical protein
VLSASSLRRPGIALAGLVAAACLQGCGQERSAEAYCEAFYAKAAPIRQAYVDADPEKDPLGAFVTLMSAPGDMVSILDGMTDHAPDEIKSDTAEVRDSFKDLQDSMGDALSDPLKAIGSGLASSLSSAGAYQRVDGYLAQHCPVDSELAQKYIRRSRAE